MIIPYMAAGKYSDKLTSGEKPDVNKSNKNSLFITCRDCNGSGHIHADGYPETMPCSTCNTSGKKQIR